MTTVTNTYNFEDKLDKMVELAKVFHKKHRGVSFSVEYTGHSNVHFSFINDSITKETAEYVQTLCDQFGFRYQVVPLSGKLAITIW